ncbi:MAG TPA: O-succinylbenzoic acid--CoA ligase, partial [Mycobacterium sp.]|nr:O-succinylbenzoic acid--CoA ligase [Mycobacterium sp.]
EPGWFHTDDLGVIDDAGRLVVLGRVDEAISTGGLTVMPAPVETVLSRHPAVADCAVFGVPDERLGERVVAAVVLVAGAVEPSVDDIKEYLSQSLDSTAAPRELHVIDELPRRGIGKVDRRALRLRFENGGDLPGGYGW